ncbi:MAG: glycosyltransferase family 4 protein, partial [Tannerellaceae bacterium]|nr:glycosyltransferase family 4 protein [Tannerellaceae bacterium]
MEKGHEIYVVSRTKPEEREYMLFFLDPRVQMISLHLPSVSRKIRKQVLPRLAEIFSDIRPDIVVVAGRQSLMYAIDIKDGSKKIIEHHGSLYRRKYKWAKLRKYGWGRCILKLIFNKDYQLVKKYDRVMVLTEEDKYDWSLYPLKNIEVIPNPISFQAEHPAPLTRKRVIAIGRLDKQKAFHRLIKIWKEVENEYPDWILSIFGNGDKKEKLVELARTLGIEKRIEFLPPTPKIQDELMNSSILAMTSLYEGLPLVLLESIACGVPPVTLAFKCGPRDVITNGVNGYYSEINDTDDFIRNLKTLMDNKELRKKIGKAAYEESNKYRIEEIMSQWIHLFE